MNKLLNNAFTLGLLVIVAIYLFVSAPAPIETSEKKGKLIPIKIALEILNTENQMIRELYASEIVGYGKKQGLKFDENWSDEKINAGLLPAQFLRATADYLQRSDIPIGLFLGSDNAINKENNLAGVQLQQFIEMKKDQSEKFSFMQDIQRYSYMFPDVASVKPCVTCHNKHSESPKKDWELSDVMGAMTWIYPDEFVTFSELVKMITSLRQGAAYAYGLVLTELKHYSEEFKIAEKWPRDGKYIPNKITFTKKLEEITSPVTFSEIKKIVIPQKTLMARK